MSDGMTPRVGNILVSGPSVCGNCGSDDDVRKSDLTGDWWCSECRETIAEIDRAIADGIRKAGYRVY